MTAAVLLVGYQDQDNLGLRYLASRLQEDGHRTHIATFGQDPAPLLSIFRAERPEVIGFSLIFQFMAPEFAAVIRALRAEGVRVHITMGGHYPSFQPETLLELIPELDSIVRFEGEDSLAELVGRVAAGASWRDVAGIAFSDGKRVVCNSPRVAREDLDSLPWPDRADIAYEHQPVPTASVLGSRGCPWKCSFCSIITFYEQNGTRGRRRRDPGRVVDEMEHLARARGVRQILFQDDDFLAGGRAATEWAHAIAAELVKRRLHDALRFKISCRSDEITPQVLLPLVEAGLAHVYLGVESGDPGDLKNLNKLLEPEVHVRAGEVLRSLDLTFDFGFMLLEPWSTLASARRNAAFLRRFSADGWVVAGFCRALPYVGTPMETRLRAEGRLTGPALEADYRFHDPRLDTLWDFSLTAFEGRNYGADATWDRLRTLLFQTHAVLPGRSRSRDLFDAARALARASNGVMLDVVDQAMDLIEAVPDIRVDGPELLPLARLARREDTLVRRQLDVLWMACLEQSAVPRSRSAEEHPATTPGPKPDARDSNYPDLMAH